MTNTRLIDRLPTIVVVGSVNMDLLFTGIRGLPVPGETVTAADFRTHPGGKGANQAAAAARLGANVLLVAAIGTDRFGEIAAADLMSSGVDLRFTSRVSQPTGVAAVLVESSGENVVVVSPNANAALDTPRADEVSAVLTGADVTVLASLEVPLAVVLAWAGLARQRGWRFILNPAPAPPAGLSDELLGLVDVITPNRGELAHLGQARLARLVDQMVVTLGADGAEVRSAGDPSSVLIPAYSVETVDTTGAGDAFNAALAVALAEGEPLIAAARFACAAGALSTTGRGARGALPDRAGVAALLAGDAGRH